MPTNLDIQLEASGSASVIVILKDSKAATISGLKRYFRHAETSQQTALLESLSVHTGGGGRRRRPTAPPAMRVYPALGLAFGTVDRKGLAALRKEKKHISGIHSAPVFSLIHPVRSAAVATPTQKVTWGINALDIPKLWAKGFTGKGILVGHLDTGADGKHPALKGAIKLFAEFDDLGAPVNPVPAAHDTGEHGTHTAGTIAGRSVAGKAIGVAPGADLACAIVIEGGNVVARVLGGMNWAVEQKVRILSMSLGLRGFDPAWEPLTAVLRQKGILPVFAVGNEGPGTSRSPGNYDDVLSVGAIDKNLLVADFSSSQKFTRPKNPLVPQLVAPGVGVISAKPGGGYQEMDGTSMATPHIAGLAALLMSAKPTKTADEVEKAIYASCQMQPGMLQSRANRGVPNAIRALDLL